MAILSWLDNPAQVDQIEFCNYDVIRVRVSKIQFGLFFLHDPTTILLQVNDESSYSGIVRCSRPPSPLGGGRGQLCLTTMYGAWCGYVRLLHVTENENAVAH